MDRKDLLKIAAISTAAGTLTSFLDSYTKRNNSPEAPSAAFTIDLSSSSNKQLLNNGGSPINNQVIVINNNSNFIVLSDFCPIRAAQSIIQVHQNNYIANIMRAHLY